MQNHLPPELVDGLAAVADGFRAIGAALAPAALGATVSQAYKRGLNWAERLVQFLVGILVSYFVGGGLVEFFGAEGFAAQAITFTVALIAYEAVPGFIRNAADVVASIPGAIRDRFLTDGCPHEAPPEWRAPARPHDNDNDPQPDSRAEES